MPSSSPNVMESLRYVAAPMVNQSDLPFRALCHEHGCTLSYTQMLAPSQLLSDSDFREFHLRDLQRGRACGVGPVVAQVVGNNPEEVVRGAREVLPWVDGIDLNLGCPQEHALQGHYGAYLLGQKDWPCIEQIVSSLSASLSVPVSVKLRLCSPTELTPTLAARLVQAGASYVTLHARHPSTRRRRHGPADLDQVRALVESSDIVVPVISNGNVRCFEDIEHNLNHTGAAGVMVGEALLADPTLFDPDTNIPPILSCVRYIELCHEHDGTATVSTARMHVKHMLEGPYSRRTWYRSFKVALDGCSSLGDIEDLLMKTGRRWLGMENAAGSVAEDQMDRMR